MTHTRVYNNVSKERNHRQQHPNADGVSVEGRQPKREKDNRKKIKTGYIFINGLMFSRLLINT